MTWKNDLAKGRENKDYIDTNGRLKINNIFTNMIFDNF